MLRRILSTLAYGLLFWGYLRCALAQDWQHRNVLHLEYELNNKFSLRAWSITNFRTQTPNNTNLFVGVGYRGKSWWLESMVQYQWNPKGNNWMLDFRFDRQAGKWHLYAEAAPFLTKRAFYEFGVVEYKVWKGFAIRGENENLHQAGRDVVLLGLGGSKRLGSLLGFDAAFAGVVRLSPVGGHTEPRIYLILNRRIGK